MHTVWTSSFDYLVCKIFHLLTICGLTCTSPAKFLYHETSIATVYYFSCRTLHNKQCIWLLAMAREKESKSTRSSWDASPRPSPNTSPTFLPPRHDRVAAHKLHTTALRGNPRFFLWIQSFSLSITKHHPSSLLSHTVTPSFTRRQAMSYLRSLASVSGERGQLQ